MFLKHSPAAWVPVGGIFATCLITAGIVSWSIFATPGTPVATKLALGGIGLAQIVGGAVFIWLIVTKR